MIPGRYDLPTIWRGCDWAAVIFKWKDANGNPINLTGKTPYVQTSGGINLNPQITDSAGGVVTLSLTKAETASVKPGDQKWDWIWWENVPQGTKYPPFIKGTVPIREPETDQFS